MVVCPLAEAVQFHQTEAPPKLPATNGSWPNCFVAVRLFPVAVTIGPTNVNALLKLSFAWAKMCSCEAKNRTTGRVSFEYIARVPHTCAIHALSPPSFLQARGTRQGYAIMAIFGSRMFNEIGMKRKTQLPWAPRDCERRKPSLASARL